MGQAKKKQKDKKKRKKGESEKGAIMEKSGEGAGRPYCFEDSLMSRHIEWELAAEETCNWNLREMSSLPFMISPILCSFFYPNFPAFNTCMLHVRIAKRVLRLGYSPFLSLLIPFLEKSQLYLPLLTKIGLVEYFKSLTHLTIFG